MEGRKTSGKPRGDRPAEATLFEAANRLRGSVESAEYKHLVLGLVFLKYVSDEFERRHAELEELTRTKGSDYYAEDDAARGATLEDRDEYLAQNVFWVPPEARFRELLKQASQPDIGPRLDRTLEAIERENSDQLRGVLPKVYAKAPIDHATLGELVSTVAKIGFGEDSDRARDVLGRTYEYFIREFARAEGHRGGEFFTPRPVVRLLVEMLEPYRGRIFDPACGSCGMFIQSAEFIAAHVGRPSTDLAIYGQEKNEAFWRIGRMNLAIHGLLGEIALGDSLLDDQLSTLRADFVIANPFFNQKGWGADQVKGDARWKWGEPPNGNANYAWIQHFASHLAPNGRAGFVLANGSLTSNTSGEGEIRRAIVEDDLVDCIVALPAQLFYTTGIPVCLWFLDRDKRSSGERDRSGEILFIDARQMGEKISRTQIELSQDEVARIAGTYHAWRGTSDNAYEDVPGYCRSAELEEIRGHEFALTPGRHVGAPESEESEVEFEEKMAGLVDELADQLAESERSTAEVRKALEAIGYEV
jgi:type I restriction enzyme M protein